MLQIHLLLYSIFVLCLWLTHLPNALVFILHIYLLSFILLHNSSLLGCDKLIASMLLIYRHANMVIMKISKEQNCASQLVLSRWLYSSQCMLISLTLNCFHQCWLRHCLPWISIANRSANITTLHWPMLVTCFWVVVTSYFSILWKRCVILHLRSLNMLYFLGSCACCSLP